MITQVAKFFGIQAITLDRLFLDYGGGETQAGINVGVRESLSYAPVWQALTMISGDISKLKLGVFRRMPEVSETANELDRRHQAFRPVRKYANERQSAKRFWTSYIVHYLLWNNAYAWIERAPQNGRVLGLHWLLPDRTTYDPKKDLYISEVGMDEPELVPFRPDEILHVQGFQAGKTEPKLLTQARESWAVGLAAQQHTSRFFAADCNAGGVLTIPPEFDKKARDKIEQGFQKAHSGQTFKTAILRDGAKFHSIQIDAEKSQMHETRTQQAREVANWFNLPPSKLGIPDSGGYGSRTEDNRNYFDQTLAPHIAEIEGECDLKLLTRAQRERDTHFFQYDYSKIVNLDRKTQADVAKIEYEMGALSPDEYRAQTGRNPRPDGKGDVYVQPNSNFVPAETDDEETAEESNGFLENHAQEFKARIANKISSESEKKNKDRFLSWLDAFDPESEFDAPSVHCWQRAQEQGVTNGFDLSALKESITNDLSRLEEHLECLK